MITLEAADLIEGDASAANVVDFTVNGVEEASSTIAVKALADGQLAAAKGTLYTTPASTTTIVKSITLVNTDSSARTVNLYVQRDGTNSRRIIPEALSLEANGGCLVLSSDGLQVFSASGALFQSTVAAAHATGHKAGGSDDLLGAPGAIGGATPAAGTFTDLTAAGDVNITLGAAENVTIDAETNPRTHSLGTIHIDHKPSIVGTRCFTLNIDANSIADTLGIAVEYLATAMAAGEVGIGIDVTVDTINASGGEVQALVVSKVGTGTLEVDAIHAGPGVLPIRQESGAFGAADNVEKTTDESAFTAITTASEMFSADNDFVYLGHSTTFNEVEWLFNTVASGAGIKPEFYFSTGAGTWTLFGPNDSTNGCRTNGVLEWELADISGTWALATYDAVSKYWIKIKRTATSITTKPVLNTMKLVSATMYSWDDSGDLTINDLTYGGTLYVFDAGGETITGDGTDLTINSGNDINLTATTDINIPANVGLTFGDDAEKIEGDGTDLTISGNIINLSPTADVTIPANKGLLFAGTEKIESDGTDLSITVGATGDINIGADIGITLGDDGEKIEGDGTDLTIASSNVLNLTATTDVIIPVNVGLKFGDGGEHIETNNTDFTITSGGELNLTAASDVVIPVNIGLHLGDGAEKLESNNTDLTINSGVDINLTATSNVNIPSGVGVTFGDDGEVISGDGTDLTIASSGILNMNAGGVESFQLSAAGILTLAKQPSCKLYLNAADQTLPNNQWTKIALDGESWDVQNEGDETLVTGTATGGTGGTTLIDSGASFVGGDVGKTVWNTKAADPDLGKFTTIASVDSGTQVTLTADIGIDDTDTYMYSFSRITITEDGTYYIYLSVNFEDIDDTDWHAIAVYKNGASYQFMTNYGSVFASTPVFANNVPIQVAASDYLELYAYQATGSAQLAAAGDTKTVLIAMKLL